MKILTFLVPCYNVEGCVRRCIDSMLVEGVISDIEILLINDGSTDSTSGVLHDYERRYPDTIRVIDKENGGWGTAINLGIREAQGKYLKEVDADDWVRSENLKPYINFLRDNECDYVATEYFDYFKSEDRFQLHGFQNECYNHVQKMADFWESYPDAWDFPIHSVTFRTALLKEMCLRVGDRYYCDLEYILYPLPYVKTINVQKIPLSIYYHGSDEQSTGNAGYRKHYKNYIDLAKRLVVFSKSLPENTLAPVKKCITDNVQGVINFAYTLLLSPTYMGKEEINDTRKDFDSWLKENGSLYYCSSNQVKKKGVPYIKLWRKLGINILTAGR